MRKALNSESLLENNKTLYQSFFANYPLVVSAPGGSILAGTFTDHIGGPGLNIKIPLRNYLGIGIIDEDKIEFENFGTYEYTTNKFEIYDIRSEHFDKIRLLQKKLSDHLGRKIGLRIGVLNELPRRNGLNNPGANAANLTAAFLIMTRAATIEEINLFQINNKTLNQNKVNLIKETAKEFHSAWLGRKAAGFGVFCCLHQSNSLQVYDSAANYPVLAIDDIYKKADYQELPFDLMIIGSSDRTDIDFTLRKYDEVEELFFYYSKRLNQI